MSLRDRIWNLFNILLPSRFAQGAPARASQENSLQNMVNDEVIQSQENFDDQGSFQNMVHDEVIQRILLIFLRMMAANDSPIDVEKVLVKGYEKDDNKKEDCVICLDCTKVAESVFCKKCKVTLHKNCIKQWLKRNPTCPACRYAPQV